MCKAYTDGFRYLVFHGGSGSTKDEIRTAVENGVVKMNVDTGKYTAIPTPCII